jgi:phage-related baseplate assembly protein
VVAAEVAASILGRWDLSVTAVLAVSADACAHVLRRRAYVSLASWPRTARTTLGRDVHHQSLSAEIRWY